MKIKYLNYILDCVIGKFSSIAKEEDITIFETRYPEYKLGIGIENSIKEWSNNRIRKEKSICRIIDLIEELNIKNIGNKDINTQNKDTIQGDIS